jgi:hypothetical protein
MLTGHGFPTLVVLIIAVAAWALVAVVQISYYVIWRRAARRYARRLDPQEYRRRAMRIGVGMALTILLLSFGGTYACILALFAGVPLEGPARAAARTSVIIGAVVCLVITGLTLFQVYWVDILRALFRRLHHRTWVEKVESLITREDPPRDAQDSDTA